jgi:AbrB family looped-hinge helix DNA binding protein
MASFEFRKKLTKEHSFRVTIPKEIIDELGWNVNDVIRISLEGDKIIIRKEKERSQSPKKRK